MNYNLKNLYQELDKIEKEILSLPKGNLLVYPNGKWHRWFYLNNTTRQYISKKDYSFASKLARKKYLELKKALILAQIDVINNDSTKAFEAARSELQELLQDKGYDYLLKPYFNKISTDDLINWQSSYNSNPKNPEQLTFQCPSGNLVRSKSEVFIDMALSSNAIPYRYECELILNGIKFYPDFTLKHPVTGDIIYWEHLGMMDNNDYAKKAFSKLQTYQANHIIPGENLILTFESRNNPFSFSDAELALSMIGIKNNQL